MNLWLLKMPSLQAILEIISKYHTPTGLLDSVTTALIQWCTSSPFHINNKWTKWKQLLGTSENDHLPCSTSIIPKHEITATGSWLLSWKISNLLSNTENCAHSSTKSWQGYWVSLESSSIHDKSRDPNAAEKWSHCKFAGTARVGKGKWYFMAFSSTNCNEITF